MNEPSNTQSPNLPAKKAEDKAMEFIPYGAKDTVKLTVAIIQNIVAVPTKTGKTCSVKDAMKFMMLCQAQRLNPFAGDAFLVGYDNNDGVATFSLITAHAAFLKRAELHPEYDGMESGIIILKEDETLLERETDFHLQSEIVVGGWAKVYCKNRKIPTYRRCRMERFNKGFAEWKKDPAGMICKCAEADALRSTFPTLLGGLYMRDEIDLPLSATKDMGDMTAQAAQAAQLENLVPTERKAEDNSNEELAPSKPAGEPTGKVSPTSARQELQAMILGEGFTFEQFKGWAAESGNVPNVDSLASFEEVPDAVARRLIRSKAGLLQALQIIRAGEAK